MFLGLPQDQSHEGFSAVTGAGPLMGPIPGAHPHNGAPSNPGKLNPKSSPPHNSFSACIRGCEFPKLRPHSARLHPTAHPGYGKLFKILNQLRNRRDPLHFRAHPLVAGQSFDVSVGI
jgi:hypothetical protein